MPIINTNIQVKQGFFHSISKVLTEDSNFIGNELYKSSHNIKYDEIWVDDISYCPDYDSAVLVSDDVTVRQIGTVSDPYYLYPLTKSNYQTWFVDTGTPSLRADGFEPSADWIKPFISPLDITNDIDIPSFGFELQLYRPSGVRISYDFGHYEVDYFSGLIRFEVNKTPKDSSQNNGLNFQFDQSSFESIALTGNTSSAINYIKNNSTGGPRCVVWQYVGKRLNNLITPGPGIKIEDNISVNLATQSGLTFSDNKLIIDIDDDTIKFIDNKIYVSGNSIYEWHYPVNTTGDSQPTGITISNTPIRYSTVNISVNGQLQRLGNSSNYLISDCYFSDGIVIKDIDDISIGDEFYWNGNVSNYNLSTTDLILLIYEANL